MRWTFGKVWSRRGLSHRPWLLGLVLAAGIALTGLAALAGLGALSRLVAGGCHRPRDQASRLDGEKIAFAAELFQVDNLRCPADFDELIRDGHVDEDTQARVAGQIELSCRGIDEAVRTGRPDVRVLLSGPDGRLGTADDLIVDRY
ncbi:MAG TPA: hypothetical protein VIU64_00955 [Polyangia bacterium]